MSETTLIPSDATTAGSSHPRIGVTSADDPTPDNYVAAVERCGGRAVILPNRIEDVEALLAKLDGLVISGGSDIDPERYGATAHDQTRPGDPARDAFELAVVRRAFELGLPTLAICRGMQIANVAWGGTMHQHIPDISDGTVVHDDAERKFETFDTHMIEAASDSLLAKLTGSGRFATNATHHQSVAKLGSGMRAVASTADGIVEALERSDASEFWLATQWHPERLLDADDGRSLNIFHAFLAAATRRAAAA